MSHIKAIVVDHDVITPYGIGVEKCWTGLFSGESAIDLCERFPTKAFISGYAGTIADISSAEDESLVMQMFSRLTQAHQYEFPKDAFLILATTTGEIDFLEKAVLEKKSPGKECLITSLLAKMQDRFGIEGGSMVVSSACSSSNSALAHAAGLIRQGIHDCVVVAACDCVSEFVFSGFSSLMALSARKAQPFGRERSGLNLGEAAGIMTIMSEERAQKEKRERCGEIAGWGMRSDAHHMTAPARDGAGMSRTIMDALERAGISPDTISAINAHGTATQYNDAMEMKAFKHVFKDRTVPTYSIKGGIGHTLGASGLVEACIALRSLKEKIVPPTVNVSVVDEDAEGWVCDERRSFDGVATLSTSAGFGGINSAVVFTA